MRICSLCNHFITKQGRKLTNIKGPGWPSGLGSSFKLTSTDHCNLSPMRREFAPGFVPYKNGLRLTRTARDKVCQLHAQGRWFSPGTPASSTSKTDRRDMTEILLKVALNPIKQTNNQIKGKHI